MNILIALLANCVKWHFTNSISIVLYCIGIPFCHAIPCCHWHWFVGETVSMESMWSLALIMKSIVIATVDRESGSSMEALLHQPQFVDGISYLAQLGTGLSPKWTVEDLEVFAINCCWNNDILSDYLESLHFFASSSLCQYEIVWLLKVVSHTHTHTCTHAYAHTHLSTIALLINTFIHSFIPSLIHSRIHWFIHLLTHWFIVALQLLSLLLYARFATGKQVDTIDAVAAKPLEDDVDSEEKDDEELLAGIDDENVREAFRVCHGFMIYLLTCQLANMKS